MKNYNKIGYSVSEVAQIFGCAPVTIRRYIYNGYLKADVSKNDKQNTIRIRREHLVEYMTEHPGRFDSELLKRFGIGTDDGKTDKKIEKKDNKADFAPGAYTVTDVSELEGAWGKQKQASKAKYEKKYPAYDIVADGKVVISGCEKLTVGKIVDALITDRNLEIANISIVRK
jgi:hypothetical protein